MLGQGAQGHGHGEGDGRAAGHRRASRGKRDPEPSAVLQQQGAEPLLVVIVACESHFSHFSVSHRHHVGQSCDEGGTPALLPSAELLPGGFANPEAWGSCRFCIANKKRSRQSWAQRCR